MMEAGCCIEVFNPYDWLPGYGENSVQTFMQGMDLMVVVSYDGENGEEQEKKIEFKGVSCFYRSSYPGPSMLGISYNVEDKEGISISRLVEFPDSEAARAWEEHYRSARKIKHYKWGFCAENVMLEIFAESVQLEESSHS